MFNMNSVACSDAGKFKELIWNEKTSYLFRENLFC